MSKFEFSSFSGGHGEFAVNSQKYTKEEAMKIFIYKGNYFALTSPIKFHTLTSNKMNFKLRPYS